MDNLYCIDISQVQHLSTWADTNIHLILLKRSMVNVRRYLPFGIAFKIQL